MFEPDEITKDDKTPYTVFTPFSKKCYSLINEKHFKVFNCKLEMLNPKNNIISEQYKYEELNKSPYYPAVGLKD